MTFNPSAPDTGPQRELIPEGLHVAYCSRIIELGEQPGYQGKPARPKAVIAFNLPGFTVEMNGETKHRMISNPFGITMSNFERADMTQYTKALNPNATNLGEFLGKPCMVNIVHYKKSNDTTGDKIDKVLRLMAGTPAPEPDIDLWWFKFDDPDMNLWEKIPEFQRKIIMEAENYKGSLLQRLIEGTDDSDSPY